MNNIIEFKYTSDLYGCFSNFSKHHIVYQDKEYFTSEHLYQGLKHQHHPEIMELVRLADTPKEAKRIARSYPMWPNWDEIKIDQMRLVISLKLEQNPKIKEKLIETGDAIIVERSSLRMSMISHLFFNIQSQRRRANC